MLGSAVVEMMDPIVAGARSIASMLESEAVEIGSYSSSTSDTEEMNTTQQQQQRAGINILIIYYQHTESTRLVVCACSFFRQTQNRTAVTKP